MKGKLILNIKKINKKENLSDYLQDCFTSGNSSKMDEMNSDCSKEVFHLAECKLSHLSSKLYFSSSDILSLLHPNSFYCLKKKILSSA